MPFLLEALIITQDRLVVIVMKKISIPKKGNNFWHWPYHLFMKEKAPYEAKAAKRKADYEKQMNAYNRKQVNNLPYCFLISGNALLDLLLDFLFLLW